MRLPSGSATTNVRLLQFGENIEVLEPAPAREVMAAVARDLAARHGTSSSA